MTKFVSSRSLLFSSSWDVSLVNSNTLSLWLNFSIHETDFSWQRLLIGAKYRHLSRPREASLIMANSNITVFPEDVGADTIMFSCYLVIGFKHLSWTLLNSGKENKPANSGYYFLNPFMKWESRSLDQFYICQTFNSILVIKSQGIQNELFLSFDIWSML